MLVILNVFIQLVNMFLIYFWVIRKLLVKKVSLKKNHEFIRYILPKGSSFKNITQEDCNLIMNNINSLCRDSLNSKSPYEAMLFLCDEDILKLLNCHYIEHDSVNFSNNLLKQK